MLLLRLALAAVVCCRTLAAETEDPSHSQLGGVIEDLDGEHEDIPPAHAVLFPSFVLTLGVLVFYVLSRL